MAIRPTDLSLNHEELVDLVDLQKEIDIKLKQFGDFSSRRAVPTMASRSDHQLPLTFPRRPGQRVIERCQQIYRILGWDVSTTVNKDALLIMIGPTPSRASST